MSNLDIVNNIYFFIVFLLYFIMEIIQYILIRSDLNMGKGKMVAQGSHASVKSYLNALTCHELNLRWITGIPKEIYETLEKLPEEIIHNNIWKWEEWAKTWDDTLYKKIVLKVNSEAELFDFAIQSYNSGFPMFLVKDVGLTQIEPNTYTALGFLCPKEAIESNIPKIKELKLL